jgi:rubrerythrin
MSYSFQCSDAIQVSMFIEKQGLLFYEKAAKKAEDPEVKKIFSQLAKEEKEHLQSLNAKSRFLQPALKNKSAVRRDVEFFIEEEIEGQIFPRLDEVDGDESFPANDLAALDIGILAEKRSIEVLSTLLLKEKKIDVRAIFSHLMVEEKKHLALLEQMKADCLAKNSA